jgi:hypothetical protein
MNTVAVVLSVTSFVWVMGVVVDYFRKIPAARVPANPIGLVLLLLAGIGLAVAALAWSYQTGSLGVAVIAPAALAIMMASMILWLLTMRRTPVGDIKVKVGDKLLAFQATTSEGERFQTEELAGKRTLLKFFRGGW